MGKLNFSLSLTSKDDVNRNIVFTGNLIDAYGIKETRLRVTDTQDETTDQYNIVTSYSSLPTGVSIVSFFIYSSL